MLNATPVLPPDTDIEVGNQLDTLVKEDIYNWYMEKNVWHRGINKEATIVSITWLLCTLLIMYCKPIAYLI